MKTKKEKNSFPSELRMDLVSQDWVVIATGRAKRPEMFKREKRARKAAPKSKCPFCKISKQEEPVLVFNRGEQTSWGQADRSWTTIVVPNKFPAFLPSPSLEERMEGKFYKRMKAVGFHEVVITKDHKKALGQLSVERVKEVFEAYQQRYLALQGERFVNYISIFHNHGSEAGASVAHPHSQIITSPLIDSDLKKALLNGKKYFQKYKKCIYCEMNKWETKVKERLVFENKDFLVLCPFASKAAFEMIVSPKKHLSNFEKINPEQKKTLAEAFSQAMRKLYKGLGNPAYNFYLHTAPCDGKEHAYYHWHWTILPKTSTWAGFEIGTRMEISTIEPEKAAEYLKKQ